mmetsp:Transcript_23961/g.51400  ORF Transcript_23961/g.51400 Transcript_23961/m.51400 type:complete len:214 (+) Transcript_23961:195-836(+)
MAAEAAHVAHLDAAGVMVPVGCWRRGEMPREDLDATINGRHDPAKTVQEEDHLVQLLRACCEPARARAAEANAIEANALEEYGLVQLHGLFELLARHCIKCEPPEPLMVAVARVLAAFSQSLRRETARGAACAPFVASLAAGKLHRDARLVERVVQGAQASHGLRRRRGLGVVLGAAEHQQARLRRRHRRRRHSAPGSLDTLCGAFWPLARRL